MRIIPRLHAEHPARRWLAAIAIAFASALIAIAARGTTPVRLLDDVIYDSMYRLRAAEDRTNGPVVIIAVDQRSLDAINSLPQGQRYGWPWPREFWAQIIPFLSDCKPKAIVFDLLFSESSIYANELDDDTSFASAIDAAKVPVVLSSIVKKDGSYEHFAPPVKHPPMLGAANVSTDATIREYLTTVYGKASLAQCAVDAPRVQSPSTMRSGDSFLLHYYGPHQRPDGSRTYRYVSAANVILASVDPSKAKDLGITPDMFRDKIVLIGAIAAGTYDAKRTPLSAECPGVEVQATAIDNLLAGQRVVPIGTGWGAAATLLAALGAAAGGAVPRRAVLKLLVVAACGVLVIGVAVAMFKSNRITWLPLASPIVAMMIATVVSLTWSYLVEDRQRRFILKALSQYVSPAVAGELSRARSLSLGGERREMTVMFTDIAGFTDLSERLADKDLERLLNFYLGELSEIVLSADGTLDKYIGDAIMSFWNAPIQQPHHAIAACGTALAMQRREREIQPELRRLGAESVFTRIGINTGPMVVGNFGSLRKFNYTIVGDQVNFGSRLEGANKIYGSQILIADSTATLVRDKFLLRQLDVLRVKGKLKPMAVFDLMAEGKGDSRQAQLATAFGQAFSKYQAMRWEESRDILLELQKDFPDDGPTATLLKRVTAFHESPPPSDWDGVYVAKSK